MTVSTRVWEAIDSKSFDVTQHDVTKTHHAIQNEIDEYDVDSIIAKLSRGVDSHEHGVTVYADEEIDCFTVPPGFINRLCRRAGVDPYAQRAVFYAYYSIVEETDFDVPPFADILVVDKTLVSGYEDEE